MKCPFCGDEMKLGYLQSTRSICWSEEKPAVIIHSDVKVSKGFWSGCYSEAEYCPRCNKIITSPAE